MTVKLLRSVLLSLSGLFMATGFAAARHAKPANALLQGIVVEDNERGETVYQPAPVAWPEPDIFLSAFLVRSRQDARRLIMGVVLRGVDTDELGTLTLSIDGSAIRLKLRSHPRIDDSGCQPTATQTIAGEDDLVRRISRA